MRRSVMLTAVSALLLAGCGAQGGSVTPHATSGTTSAQGMTRHPYSIPIVGRAPANVARARKLSLGGILTVTVSIIDAPTFNPGDQVNLAVTGVDLLSNGVAYNLTTYAQPQPINVLNYQASAFNLGSNSMPALTYDTVRLHVASTQSSVVTGGQTYPMVFGTTDPTTGLFAPSAAQTTTLDMPLPSTSTDTSIVIDFNAMESINLAGGKANVTPTLHAIANSTAAQITGVVAAGANGMPVSNATVTAVAADGSVAASSLTNAAGAFNLHCMSGGSYTIKVYNTYTTAAGQVTTATGNANSAAMLTGPTVNVPAGMSLNIQQILD